MEELWKWISGLLAGMLIGQGALMWKLISAIRDRPTFEEVEALITKNLEFTPYEKDRRWLTEEMTELKKDVEKVDRHVEVIRPKVEELHIWMTLQREREQRRLNRAEGREEGK